MTLDKTITAVLAVVCGFSGIYLLSKPKSAFENDSKPGGQNFSLYSETIFENKEAEIIGEYLSHGIGGTTFRLPSGDVLKIVSLEKEAEKLKFDEKYVEKIAREKFRMVRPGEKVFKVE